jgi:hypothetical protein
MPPQDDKVESQLARLSRRAAEVGLSGLELSERTALLAFLAHGVIAQGGFKQFYLTEFRLADLVEALRELKLPALANAAEATAAQFPEPALADDAKSRQPHLERLDTGRQDYVFFRLSSEELLNAIGKYWKAATTSQAVAKR